MFNDSEQLTVGHGRQNDTANENIKTHDEGSGRERKYMYQRPLFGFT